MSMNEYRFYRTCVSWPDRDVPALSAMIEASTDITRRTFLKHVNREDLKQLEDDLNYAAHWMQGGLTMAADWHVSYHRSKLHGRRVYYFRHSAIEYVFVRS
jgi:hypothetical protein